MPPFDPETWSTSPTLHSSILSHLSTSDFQSALTLAFSLPSPPDPYIYRAIAAVTLPQAQRAISLGRANGLHSWYLSPSPPTSLPPPPLPDISAYITIFLPTSSPSKALSSLSSNAKKDSIRSQVATYLLSKRHLDTTTLGGSPGRQKKLTSFNPALDFWAWACKELEWAGPCEASTRSHIAHPILPLFMHHFGCVAPSFEALEILRLVVERRRKIDIVKAKREVEGVEGKDKGAVETTTMTPAVVDMGSGNGYWSYVMRRHGLVVHAVDSGQSVFRTEWIGDTQREDGVRWLKRMKGAEGDVLLMVYPVVGADFTRAMLKEYKGKDVVVAGTQNRNGYTGFKDMTMDEFFEREMAGWRMLARVPLPSFAGKDEALFVFTAD